MEFAPPPFTHSVPAAAVNDWWNFRKTLCFPLPFSLCTCLLLLWGCWCRIWVGGWAGGRDRILEWGWRTGSPCWGQISLPSLCMFYGKCYFSHPQHASASAWSIAHVTAAVWVTVGLSGTLKSPVENPEPGHGGILPQHRSCCIGNKIQDAHPIQDRWEKSLVSTVGRWGGGGGGGGGVRNCQRIHALRTRLSPKIPLMARKGA